MRNVPNRNPGRFAVQRRAAGRIQQDRIGLKPSHIAKDRANVVHIGDADDDHRFPRGQARQTGLGFQLTVVGSMPRRQTPRWIRSPQSGSCPRGSDVDEQTRQAAKNICHVVRCSFRQQQAVHLFMVLHERATTRLDSTKNKSFRPRKSRSRTSRYGSSRGSSRSSMGTITARTHANFGRCRRIKAVWQIRSGRHRPHHTSASHHRVSPENGGTSIHHHVVFQCRMTLLGTAEHRPSASVGKDQAQRHLLVQAATTDFGRLANHHPGAMVDEASGPNLGAGWISMPVQRPSRPAFGPAPSLHQDATHGRIGTPRWP